jgi:AcrR family transcriptional regulator
MAGTWLICRTLQCKVLAVGGRVKYALDCRETEKKVRRSMKGQAKSRAQSRAPVTRESVIAEAVQIADDGGVAAVSMRGLAKNLGVEAMSLYHHLPNKEAILDGMVDHVFSEIELPGSDGNWKVEMRRRAISARSALLRHPWAVGLMDSRRNPGPPTLRHHDAVIGCLRAAGFPIPMVGHAVSVIDSYVYGFEIQEQALPFDTPEELQSVADGIFTNETAELYPHLAELASKHVLQTGYAYGDEFGFGLDLVLDGLERALDETEKAG